jgi:hypothetical protein
MGWQRLHPDPLGPMPETSPPEAKNPALSCEWTGFNTTQPEPSSNHQACLQLTANSDATSLWMAPSPEIKTSGCTAELSGHAGSSWRFI